MQKLARHTAAAALLAGLAAGCGEVQDRPDAPTADAAPDASADAPPDVPPCTTYAGAWDTNAIAFDGAIAPTARLAFETRADGVTGVTAGTPVPPDEYLACCGIRLEFAGTQGGQIIWAGNAQTGFSVRATCAGGICSGIAGIRITFVPPVTAVGMDYAGSIQASVFSQGSPVAQMSVGGSGVNFLGYRSAVRLDRADLVDNGGEDIARLLYHRCP